MRSTVVLAATFATALVGFARQAHAFCQPGDVQTCFLNGKEGTRTCGDNAMYGPCEVPEDPPPPTCQAQPKYTILTVVYAPPGHTGGGSSSSVSYAAGSS